jgi:hypothetical protein
MSLLAAGTAQAAVSWMTPSGSTNDFNYDHGNTDNQLFVPAGTDPTVTPTSLLFFPSNFKASSANGLASNPVSDTLRFQIHVKPGKQLSAFQVNETGDYTITGSGANTLVKAFGTVFLTNLDTGEVRFDTLHTIPAPLSSTGVTTGQGVWNGDENIASIPAGWRNIQVVLNNVLQTGSDPGTSAFIEKKGVGTGVEIIIIIPEPASALILLAAATFALKRPRRVF